MWSGQRDSDPRSQPWQGCALPTKLCPHVFHRGGQRVKNIQELKRTRKPRRVAFRVAGQKRFRRGRTACVGRQAKTRAELAAQGVGDGVGSVEEAVCVWVDAPDAGELCGFDSSLADLFALSSVEFTFLAEFVRFSLTLAASPSL